MGNTNTEIATEQSVATAAGALNAVCASKPLLTKGTATLFILAAMVGIFLAWKIAYAIASPDERELDMIYYGELEGQQTQLHQENLNDYEWLEEQTRIVRERQTERSRKWNEIEVEQVQLYNELFL